jgi:diazepam-binding inhibitor (GABA receptor modulator, acyl-CoA-binding protein)
MTFEEAQEKVKTLSRKPNNEQLLKLYSLYKQGMEGDNAGSGPSNPFDFVAKAKHDARESLKGKTKDEAKIDYVSYVQSLLDAD